MFGKNDGWKEWKWNQPLELLILKHPGGSSSEISSALGQTGSHLGVFCLEFAPLVQLAFFGTEKRKPPMLVGDWVPILGGNPDPC